MEKIDLLKYGLPALLIAFLLFFLAPRVSSWVGQRFDKRPYDVKLLATGAEVISVDGRVHLEGRPLSQPETLGSGSQQRIIHHRQTLRTGARSSAQVKLRDAQIELGEYSSFRFDLWNPDEPSSPLYIVVHSGHFRVLQPGQAGQIYMVVDGALSHLKDPEVEPRKRQLVISQALIQEDEVSPLGEEGDDDDFSELGNLEEEDGLVLPGLESTADSSSRNHNTLSNSYIDEVIARQRRQFQRCQSNNLRENRPAQGDILVGLIISPRGRVSETRLLNSSIGDETMENCILSVFERLQFSSFSGPAVQRSYPLTFE